MALTFLLLQPDEDGSSSTDSDSHSDEDLSSSSSSSFDSVAFRSSSSSSSGVDDNVDSGDGGLQQEETQRRSDVFSSSAHGGDDDDDSSSFEEILITTVPPLLLDDHDRELEEEKGTPVLVDDVDVDDTVAKKGEEAEAVEAEEQRRQGRRVSFGSSSPAFDVAVAARNRNNKKKGCDVAGTRRLAVGEGTTTTTVPEIARHKKPTKFGRDVVAVVDGNEEDTGQYEKISSARKEEEDFAAESSSNNNDHSGDSGGDSGRKEEEAVTTADAGADDTRSDQGSSDYDDGIFHPFSPLILGTAGAMIFAVLAVLVAAVAGLVAATVAVRYQQERSTVLIPPGQIAGHVVRPWDGPIRFSSGSVAASPESSAAKCTSSAAADAASSPPPPSSFLHCGVGHSGYDSPDRGRNARGMMMMGMMNQSNNNNSDMIPQAVNGGTNSERRSTEKHHVQRPMNMMKMMMMRGGMAKKNMNMMMMHGGMMKNMNMNLMNNMNMNNNMMMMHGGMMGINNMMMAPESNSAGLDFSEQQRALLVMEQQQQQLQLHQKVIQQLESTVARHETKIAEFESFAREVCREENERASSLSAIWSTSRTRVLTSSSGGSSTGPSPARPRTGILQCDSKKSSVSGVCSRYLNEGRSDMGDYIRNCPAALTAGSIYTWSLRVEELPDWENGEGGGWQLELGVVLISSSWEELDDGSHDRRHFLSSSFDENQWLSQQPRGWSFQGPSWPLQTKGWAGHNGSWTIRCPRLQRGSKVTFQLDLVPRPTSSPRTKGEEKSDGFGSLSVSVDGGPVIELFGDMVSDVDVAPASPSRSRWWFAPAVSTAATDGIRVSFLGFE